MKLLFRIFVLLIYVLSTWALYADIQIRSSINKDSDASVAYNSVDDEYIVVWTELSATSSQIMGQRVKADGTGNIGASFTISSIGVYPSVAYNSQSNEYLVTSSLFGSILGQRVSNTGVLIGSPFTYLSKIISIWSKIVYNSIGSNYLLVGAELADLGNDQSNIKIYTLKIAGNGQAVGTEKLIRDQGHGNYSDGARFSIAYAPITLTETPMGRFLLAIKDPTDLTMLDDNGAIVSRVYDSQKPGDIVDDHIPFQSSKVGIPNNIDVAFGNWEGQDAFMIVWGDRDQSINNQEWTGIWAGIVKATPIEFQSEGGVSNTVFPVSGIWAHWATTSTSKTWKPVVAYNKVAYKFMIAWRETPSTDPNNDTKVNHIRSNAVSSSIIPPPANVVLSAITGSEDPQNPAIAVSTKNTNALVVWDDMRNFSTLDIDLYGNLLSTSAAKTLVLTSPNGNEEWIEGTEHQITWESSGIGAKDIKIEYSIDHGASFNFIAFKTNIDGTNNYIWTLPLTPSTQCLVKISETILSDESDGAFTIKETPKITVLSPNGGEVWQGGTQQQIKWESVNIGNFDVTIEYSTDNGSNYQFITFFTNIDGQNTFNWDVPNISSTQCFVRISLSEVIDISNSVFTIIGTPNLTVISPNGEEEWIDNTMPLELMDIKWTTTNFTEPVRIDIEYSTQNQKWFKSIAEYTDNDGSYETVYWAPTGLFQPPLMHARIRVADATKNTPDGPEDGKVFDWSDSSFIIIAQSGITVVSPNGGEVWDYGSQQEIKWTSTSLSNIVTIGLSVYDPDNGLYGSHLVTTPNDGSFIWNVDANWKSLDSLKCMITIEAGDMTDSVRIFDDCDTYFTVIKNTSTGASVNIDLGNGAEITFDSVSNSGTTTLSVTQTGAPPPNSYMVFGSSTYYNIETTAEFTGNLKIRINYADTGLTPYEESILSLHVYETPPGQWKDITTSLDMANNIICGEVNHLSEFAIMMPSSDPQVYFVTNTNDSGEGTFRKAIDDANSNASADKILFNIPKTDPNYDVVKGVWYIRPVTYYQSILDSGTVIDGTSQRIFIGEDTNPEGPEIEISGNIMSTNNGCLNIIANNIEIYEVTINNFGSSAINFWNSSNHVVSGCYIGTDYTGMKSEGNRDGITMGPNVNGTLIGPSIFLGNSNVISGNTQNGVFIVDNSKNNAIIGNYIGVNKNATDTIRNKLRGIDLSRGADSNTIMENIIGGNYQGVYVSESNENLIRANKIGTNETWEYDLYNSDGILVFINSSRNTISENIIGYNRGWGIKVAGTNSKENRISRNSISKNWGHGIDNSDGGNAELTVPLITSVVNNQITGSAGPNQIIEIFADSVNEGQIFIDSTSADLNGNFSISISNIPNLPYITATATDNLGNTSEFSSPLIITEIKKEENELPTSFALQQNYPNPFNPSTTIQYSIPSNVKSEKKNVKITIYDILGNEVLILVNKYQSAGDYELMFNAKELSSGVYFYQLKSGSFSMTKKMLYLE